MKMNKMLIVKRGKCNNNSRNFPKFTNFQDNIFFYPLAPELI